MTSLADVDLLSARIERYLRESNLDAAPDDAGDFMIPFKSTITWVRPTLWKDDRTLVRIWSITNVDMRSSDELTHFLVATNARLAFGGLHLDARRPAVIMAHSLLGDYLNRIELQVGVAAVAGAADRFGPEIKELFGGKLFTEA